MHCRSRTSVRRRSLRLALGANKKIKVHSVERGSTVRVVASVVKPQRCRLALKASEGVERSCRQRRSRRGQRKGKLRARVRHTRDPRLPAPEDKFSERKLNRRLRVIDWAQDRVEQFGRLLGRSKLFSPRLIRIANPGYLPFHIGRVFVTLSVEKYMPAYRAWEARWLTLRNRIRVCGEEALMCSRIGPTFRYYLEQQRRILIDLGGRTPILSAERDLLDLQESLRIRKEFVPMRGKLPAHKIPMKRSSDRFVDHPPFQYKSGTRWYCSHCGSQAPVWRLHACARLGSGPSGRRERRSRR